MGRSKESDVSEPPVSPYRVGPWTVRKLRDELRVRSLPTTGNKDDLIKRLESAAVDPSKEWHWTVDLRSPRAITVVEEVSSSAGKEYSTMTITLLQKELKSRQLPYSGRKDVLIQRLIESDSESVPASQESAKFSPQKSPSKKQSPTKRGSSVSLLDGLDPSSLSSDSPMTGSKSSSIAGVIIPTASSPMLSSAATKPTFFTAPHKVLWFSLLFFASRTVRVVKYLISHKKVTASILLLISAMLAANFTEGPHQQTIRNAEKLLFWYGRWFVLGVLSSIGLGTGAHTFLLFLGPFIAEATTAAFTCKSLDFATEGANRFICPAKAQSAAITIWQIANKVKWEAFLWGAGTAFGELPPYFIARASAMAGKSTGEISELKEMQHRPRNKLSLAEKAQLWMFYLVQYLGFVGILLCASIPNPLFDLAGITCGYFGVPFLTFWGATFIGKSFFKAGIQTLFVIFLFSQENIKFLIAALTKMSPEAGAAVSSWLDAQKATFLSQKGAGAAASATAEQTNLVGMIWNGVLAVMLGYFAISILQSVAAIYLSEREEAKRKKKKTK